MEGPYAESLRYMVAIDGSEASEWGFQTAVDMMNKNHDKLVLITVVPHPKIEDKKATLIAARNILKPYALIAKDLGISYSIVASLSCHPALSITNYSTREKIDVLCLGRSKPASDNPNNDDFSTSTSLYCVEHASCTVVVARSNPR